MHLVVKFVSFGADWDALVVLFLKSVPADAFSRPGFKTGVGWTASFLFFTFSIYLFIFFVANTFVKLVVIGRVVVTDWETTWIFIIIFETFSANTFVFFIAENLIVSTLKNTGSITISYQSFLANALPRWVIENLVLSTFRDAHVRFVS